jgi:gas vesicle protein
MREISLLTNIKLIVMNGNGKVISALLLGAAAGAVIGLLFAPDKGEETRRKLQTGAQDLMNQLSNKINEGTEALSNLKQQAYNKAGDLKDQVASKADQLRNDISDEAANLKHKTRSTSNY